MSGLTDSIAHFVSGGTALRAATPNCRSKKEEMKAKFLDCSAGAGYLDAGAWYQASSNLGGQASLRKLGASTATA